MSVQIKTNRAAWKAALEKAADKAVDALANQMMNDSLDYIPTDGENNLRDIGRIENDGSGERSLVWDNVYAGVQWFGAWKDGTHQIKNYTTPGTGKAWVDQAKSAQGENWDTVVQNGFTEGLR